MSHFEVLAMAHSHVNVTLFSDHMAETLLLHTVQTSKAQQPDCFK